MFTHNLLTKMNNEGLVFNPDIHYLSLFKATKQTTEQNNANKQSAEMERCAALAMIIHLNATVRLNAVKIPILTALSFWRTITTFVRFIVTPAECRSTLLSNIEDNVKVLKLTPVITQQHCLQYFLNG